MLTLILIFFYPSTTRLSWRTARSGAPTWVITTIADPCPAHVIIQIIVAVTPRPAVIRIKRLPTIARSASAGIRFGSGWGSA